MVQWVGLQSVIAVFPDYIHLLFYQFYHDVAFWSVIKSCIKSKNTLVYYMMLQVGLI